ncbi:MAG TPA: redoxin domain-containing protein [Pyrinomonadaceae bacterium]|nr:redoxin domain-containing protein [Pyrinomonadaceae bacterium]
MKRTVLMLAVIAGVAIAFGVFSGSGRADGIQIGAAVENFSLPDLNGETKSLNELKGKNGAVLVWLSAQCPVVKGYNDRILEISEEFKAKGINFVGINSNATESLDWVKSNASEVGYKFPILIDKNNVLADKFAASVTPEVYYFDAKNVLLYHGAIDNDRSGRNITTQYLRDAADSALGGKAISTTRANAFGCTIKRAEKQ